MTDEMNEHETENEAAPAVATAEPEAEQVAAPPVDAVAAPDDAEPPAAPPIETVVAASPPPAPVPGKRWYVVKVQSGREDSIRNAIERRVKIEGVEEFFGRVLIPTEKVTELRNGKRVVKKRKKFPGYLMVEVEFNDRILYLFRETSGVGDFVGGSLHKVPPPMNDREVERMLADQDDPKTGETTQAKPKVLIPYNVGDRVKVRDGTFAGMEGEVKDIQFPADAKENPKVKVVLSIWGRPVDVDVEYWQVDQV